MAVKVGSFAKSTGAATVAQAVTGVGFKPRVVILWTDGSATSADTWTDHFQFAVGFAARNSSETITVGSTSGASQDAQDTSNTSYRAASKALTICTWSEGVVAECDMTSFDTDGFTLSWTTNNATAYPIHYMALGGDNLTDAYVKAWTTGTSNTAVGVTGVGFQPDCVLHLQGPTGALPATAAGCSVVFGAMTSGYQFVTSVGARDNLGTSSTGSAAHTSYAILAIVSPGTNDYTGAYTSLDADGFTITIANTPAASYNVFSLCLKGGSYKLGLINPKASPAAYTGIGFEPEGLLFANSGNTGDTTTGTSGLKFSIGATDGVANESALINDEFNVGTTNAAGRYSASYCITFEGSGNQGTPDTYGNIVSLDEDGLTINWVASLAAHDIYYFAFAGGTIAATGLPIDKMFGKGFGFRRDIPLARVR